MKRIKYFLTTITILGFCFINVSFNKEQDIVTHYYIGESKVMTPDSVNLGTFVILTKQIVNKIESTITMQAISLDQKGETKEYNYTMYISDPKYTLKDANGEYFGSGRLHGKEWMWTYWDYNIEFKNPVGKMIGKDYVSLVGLIVNKDFYGADGTKLMHYHEKHKFLTKEAFEILYMQVLKGSTK